jgi:hypothetical protein
MARGPVRGERTSTQVSVTLSQELIASACRFAQRALRARGAQPPRLDRFFLDAGTSLEHLAKAYLASIHPSLIIDGRYFDALLHACGRPDLARTPATTIRTITVTEAVQRCIRLLPRQLQGVEQERHLGPLIEARNSVAHIGRAAEAAVATQVFVPYLGTLTALGEALDISPTSLWGDHASYVAMQLSDSATKTQRAVTSRVAGSRVTFRERYGRLPPGQRDLLLTTIVTSYPRASSGVEKYDQALLTCPACSTDVMVEGGHTVNWEADYDTEGGESYVDHVFPVVTFLPMRLECRACGLKLSGQEELHAAGLDPVELDDVDEQDLIEELYDVDASRTD